MTERKVVWTSNELTIEDVELLKINIGLPEAFHAECRAAEENENTREAMLFHDRIGEYILAQWVSTIRVDPAGASATIDLNWPMDTKYQFDQTADSDKWPWPDSFIIDHVSSHIREVPLQMMSKAIEVMAETRSNDRTASKQAKALLEKIDLAKIEVKP